MKNIPATGGWGKYRESPYLASEDVLAVKGCVVIMTIKDVLDHPDAGFADGRKERVQSLGFKEFDKKPEDERRRMILNSTNKSKLADLFGPNVEQCLDRKVKVYVEKDVKSFGKTTTGLRIAGVKEALPKNALILTDAAKDVAGMVAKGSGDE